MALEWDQVRRILILVMIVSFGAALLGLAGELLGWWNDVGELLISTGTVVGALAGIVTLVGGASEQTVEAIHETVEHNNELLETNNAKLDKLDKLDGIGQELDQQTTVLQQIRDRL